MTQSIFHVKHTDSSLNNDIHKCYEAMSAFTLYSHQYDGAGTYFMQSIAQAMQGTPYQHMADECLKNLNEIFLARQTLKSFEQCKTLESALFTLKGHLDAGNHKDVSKIYAQTVFRILLQFIQMQNTYYNYCQEKLVHLVSKLNTGSNRDSESPEKQSIPSQSTPVDSPSKYKPTKVDHNSPKISKSPSPKHQSSGNSKSSFFSFFERKSVPREKQSAFYVEVTEDKNENGGMATLGLDGSQSSTRNDNNSPCTKSPNSCASSSSSKHDVSVELASEEEIDSVINLLSKAGVQSSTSTMQSIPENQIQLTVPQLYRMPSPASDSQIDELKPPTFQVHRRSEGSLDLPSMHKNIWHSPHRGSLPGSHSPSPRHTADINNVNMGSNVSRRYSHELHTSYRLGSPYMQPSNQLWPGSQWLTPSINNTWLMNPNSINAHGSDTMNSSWSGVHDSSDLSDDDSCGEQFFAVGQDLVHALDAKEYSSEEDKSKGEKLGINEKTNTWPPLQTWENPAGVPDARSELVQLAEDSQVQHQQHRPVQMQWSDPMSTHSMWPSNPPGVPQQRHSQSMQGFSLYQ